MAASLLGGLDIGLAGVPSGAAAAAVFGSIAMNGDEYVRCVKCYHGGCDLRVQGCGCTVHARCISLRNGNPLSACPHCNRPTNGLMLFPMSFREIDEARKTVVALANTGRRGRKRKSSDVSGAMDEKGVYVSERRTGRWTTEEMAYCDKLIDKFESGELPLVNGIKLNDFLGSMLKSKQSRLTKKMKNAKLSSKTFERTTGCLMDPQGAREFSDLEESFFHSVQCHQERAEIKFHMQKEWRELFSNLCVSVGQPLDADAWLSSVEEMDRRASNAKDAARMARRKLMMGFALKTDSKNPDSGIYIEKSDNEAIEQAGDKDAEEMLSLLAEKSAEPKDKGAAMELKQSMSHSAPFLSKAVAYMKRHNVPFEHVDLWVPSFVPTTGEAAAAPDGSTSCRLCYAGSATADFQAGPDGKVNVPLDHEALFNLHAFGDYSQKFSFDVGCGLPGRVYQTGLPTWEQSVQNAPHEHFERCGGALQWGIKTVVGIPIASPNVGRIVVTLYSRSDREKDQELVGRLSEEFTRLMPSPKWKLVVDVGEPDIPSPVMQPPVQETSTMHMHQQQAMVANAANAMAVAAATMETSHDPQPDMATTMNAAAAPSSDVMAQVDVSHLVSLLGEYMPSDPTSPLSTYLPGFMSLRLMLLRRSKTPEEEELVRTMLGSYQSYSSGGRAKSDIALMLARDYMFLTQQQHQQQQQQPPPHQQPLISLGPNNSMMAPSAASSASAPSVAAGGAYPSPAMAPIPVSGNGADAVSIVSN